MGLGGDLDRIVNRSIKDLSIGNVAHETTTKDNENTAITKNSRQTPNLPSTADIVKDTNQDMSIPLDSSSANYHSFAMVWVFLSVLLVTFILTVLAWIIRNYCNANKGNTK